MDKWITLKEHVSCFQIWMFFLEGFSGAYGDLESNVRKWLISKLDLFLALFWQVCYIEIRKKNSSQNAQCNYEKIQQAKNLPNMF
jgi:hypothetical protein